MGMHPFYSPLTHNAFTSYGGLAAYPTLSPDAVSTLYIEGLPLDATEREVSHIFRQMPGYLSLRILPKESKQHPNRTYNLCFVEFDHKYQATMAMHTLQGYKMDKNDTKGLSISYAKTSRKERRPGPSPIGTHALEDDQGGISVAPQKDKSAQQAQV